MVLISVNTGTLIMYVFYVNITISHFNLTFKFHYNNFCLNMSTQVIEKMASRKKV